MHKAYRNWLPQSSTPTEFFAEEVVKEVVSRHLGSVNHNVVNTRFNLSDPFHLCLQKSAQTFNGVGRKT